jgi:hypothetical protein
VVEFSAFPAGTTLSALSWTTEYESHRRAYVLLVSPLPGEALKENLKLRLSLADHLAVRSAPSFGARCIECTALIRARCDSA